MNDASERRASGDAGSQAIDGDGWLQHHLATPFGATPNAI
jgi:hypothetical protein